MADIRKAFDNLSWRFIESVLAGLGFLKFFADWIMECVTTSSYSLTLNGNLHGFFNGKGGILKDILFPHTYL